MNDLTPTPAAPAQPSIQVRPKSPQAAAIASFFVPGFGSLICGNTAGLFILVCWFVSWAALPVFGPLALWIWGMVHAYLTAKNWNTAHGVIS